MIFLELKKYKDELLVELNVKVTQIEWSFCKIEEKNTDYCDNVIETSVQYNIFFEGTHKVSKDRCFITIKLNHFQHYMEVGYYHLLPPRGMSSGDNRLHWANTKNSDIFDYGRWDEANEFFNEYCIGRVGRLEKIKSGEMITPNMKEVRHDIVQLELQDMEPLEKYPNL
jgi:hypothetical protein